MEGNGPRNDAVTKFTTWAHSYQAPRLLDTSLLALQPREVFHRDLMAVHLKNLCAWSRLRFRETNSRTVPDSPAKS